MNEHPTSLGRCTCCSIDVFMVRLMSCYYKIWQLSPGISVGLQYSVRSLCIHFLTSGECKQTAKMCCCFFSFILLNFRQINRQRQRAINSCFKIATHHQIISIMIMHQSCILTQKREREKEQSEQSIIIVIFNLFLLSIMAINSAFYQFDP